MEAESEEVLSIFFLFLCNAAEETEACSSQSSALVTTSLGTRSHTLASHQLICCAIRAYFCTEHRQSPTVWPKTICMQAIFYALFLLILYPHCHPNWCCSDSTSERSFVTRQKCRGGQQTLISCTLFKILHLQHTVLFQKKSPMSTFSMSGDRFSSHTMPRTKLDDSVYFI